MKSAYELAMERLNKTSPSVKLTEQQKKLIAELDSKYQAKIAEREIAIGEEVTSAEASGDWTKAEELRQQLVFERKKLLAELDEKKEEVRRK